MPGYERSRGEHRIENRIEDRAWGDHVPHFADVFEALSDAIPDAPCLVQGSRSVSWREFDESAARLASALGSAGVGRDDKVGIYLYNSPEWMVAFYAALKIRAVPVSVNYRYADGELAYLLDDCEAAAVVFHSAFAERMARVAPTLGDRLRLLVEVDDGSGESGIASHQSYASILRDFPDRAREVRASDDSMLVYTGGTTGYPKGVIFPVGTLTLGTLASPSVAGVLGIGGGAAGKEFVRTALDRHASGDTAMSCPVIPLMHAAGLALGALPALCTGGTVVFLPMTGFDPETLTAAIETYRIKSIVIAGDAIARPLVHHLREATAAGTAHDVSSLRVIVTSGVAMTADAQRAIFDVLPDVAIHDQGGSTEGGLGFRLMRKDDDIATSRFVPFPGVRVLRPDGTDVEPGSGERGLLACPTMVTGYYKDPVKTADVFREIDGRLYAVAGDWATMEADGTVTLIGRGSSVINTGGEKVFPEEVEEVILAVPGVADCVVVGTPDERFGQVVTAVVARRDPQLAESDVAGGVRERLAGYKVPRRVVFVAQVPRLATGKPDRPAVVQLANEQLEQASSA